MKNLVCVTGASGFLASWLVKFLLESGYHVRGLVRSPGSSESYENSTYGVVDVKDVARAHMLAYETPSAIGRYFCCHETVTKRTMVEIIRKLYPGYALPSRCIEVQRSATYPKQFSTNKLQDLGLTYTPSEITLKETVESLKEKGFF